ncbi:putative alternative oxidase protein [Phaeoacremonium minimum UCRPA7]|uniref:Putative alternative oxidase protein n=1 Tax=Phaeoacremonium minimum (strain UCR-PA7) TaxID=1286976 RepID=R8BRX2_PHAM7|nr:putative alternative oxidase protein [Phaeoacremonium minimum UCRPA7]EOO02074.1 putative alternative oxidase protein [Phaeoacremonium minimum UCRPA7]
MLDSARLFGVLKFGLPLILIIWSLAYLTTSRDTYVEIFRKFKNEKKLFVSDYLEHEIDGDFDGTKIRELCASKPWADKDRQLILTCHPPEGGIGAVKNQHLHCIRLAIEIGADVVFPDIVRRSDTDITKLNPHPIGPPKGIPMDYFFDFNHLNQSLAAFCPQMKVYRSLNDLYDVPSVLQAETVALHELTENFVNGTIIEYPDRIRRQFYEHLEELKPAKNRIYPMRVHLAKTAFAWPTAYDDPGFTKNFGRILRIREDIRLLAASGLYNMQKRFNLNLDPRNGIKRDSFIGVHLRTEKDVAGEFPPYETQAAYYLNYLAQNHIPVVYLATGATEENVTAFAERAQEFGATSVLKRDILDAPELALLDTFSWDQRALIDYEIMLRAGLITGTSESVFAWNLAMRRKNAYGSSGESKPLNPELSIQWQDQYSTIFGDAEKSPVYKATIWP